jgi:hypothetical protein
MGPVAHQRVQAASQVSAGAYHDGRADVPRPYHKRVPYRRTPTAWVLTAT